MMRSIQRNMRKSGAFIRRDYLIAASYRIDFLMAIAGSLLPLIFFTFLSKLMAVNASADLTRYGGHFLPFVAVGIAFARFFQLALRLFSETMRVAQMTGCLEMMLSSQTNPLPIVFMSSFYSLIWGFVQMLLILGASWMWLGLNLSQANLTAAAVIFALSVLTFIAFGILSSAVIVLIKRGDPVSLIVSSAGALLGGAYFPVDVMPGWLQALSIVVPITYSLDALRLTLLQGYSLEMVWRQAALLGMIALVLLPLSLGAFAWAVRKGRRDGTLMQY